MSGIGDYEGTAVGTYQITEPEEGEQPGDGETNPGGDENKPGEDGNPGEGGNKPGEDGSPGGDESDSGGDGTNLGKMEINREVRKRTPAETSLSPAEADPEKMWIRPEGTSRRGIRLALVWIPSRNPLP